MGPTGAGRHRWRPGLGGGRSEEVGTWSAHGGLRARGWSGESGEPAQRGDGGGERGEQREADCPVGDLALLGAVADRRADVGVDLLQLVARGRGVGGAVAARPALPATRCRRAPVGRRPRRSGCRRRSSTRAPRPLRPRWPRPRAGCRRCWRRRRAARSALVAASWAAASVEARDGAERGLDGGADGGATGERRPVERGQHRGRSSVGATATEALPAKVTSPTLNVSGSPSTNVRAAVAAAIRVGSTSVARIEIDVSTATITVARSRGTSIVIMGRDRPSTRPIVTSTNATAGTCRRQPGPLPSTRSSSGSAANRTA